MSTYPITKWGGDELAMVIDIFEEKASRRQKGFTLVEIMVTVFIVGTLASVAVPLYAEYVERAKIAEVTCVIGGIITSEKLEMQRFPSRGFYSAVNHEDFLAKGLDLSDTKYFKYQVKTNGRAPATKFTITATATSDFSDNVDECTITYRYNPASHPAGKWDCEGTCVAEEIISSQ